MARILVCDSDHSRRAAVQRRLAEHNVTAVDTINGARAVYARRSFDLVVISDADAVVFGPRAAIGFGVRPWMVAGELVSGVLADGTCPLGTPVVAFPGKLHIDIEISEAVAALVRIGLSQIMREPQTACRSSPDEAIVALLSEGESWDRSSEMSVAQGRELHTRVLEALGHGHWPIPTFHALAQVFRLTSPSNRLLLRGQALVACLHGGLGWSEQGRRSLHPKVTQAILVFESAESPLTTRRTARTVGAALHVDPSHLGRLIQSSTGLSVRDWDRSGRLRAAVTTLMADRHDIRQIAFRLGWHSASAFNRDFRAVFGMTPTAFRSEKDDQDARRRRQQLAALQRVSVGR